MTFSKLMRDIKACRVCEKHLPLEPRPVVQAHPAARLLIIGQAPGRKVHETGIPWDDPSGDRLRRWMGVEKDVFYDVKKIAIVPMGFCYPGKGASGDLPPRPECAPLWHAKLLHEMQDIRLTLLVGQYAQAYYLGAARKKTLTQTVQAWREYLSMGYFPMVHPSPRNQIWLRKNPWFEEYLVLELKKKVKDALKQGK